jgi:hypothetical protein
MCSLRRRLEFEIAFIALKAGERGNSRSPGENISWETSLAAK